jgi:hypothetical protein
LLGWNDARVHTPCAAVTVGLSAHAAAVGCLPALLPTLLVVPVALLGVRAMNVGLMRQSAVVRLLAGQTIVHIALTAAAACAAHARPESAMEAVPDLVTTAVHLLSLVLGVAALSRVEQAVHAWVVSARRLLRTCGVRSSLRTACVATFGLQGLGFVPRSAARLGSRLVRGPPTGTAGLFA